MGFGDPGWATPSKAELEKELRNLKGDPATYVDTVEGQCKMLSKGAVCTCLKCVLGKARERDALAARVKELEKYHHDARNLLAVVHRDGGHYVTEHGFQKACEDAAEEYLRRRDTDSPVIAGKGEGHE